MKAITLYQPHATLVALGAKTIETRSWSTTYRGPLAIHAGMNRRFIKKGKDYICANEPFYSVLMQTGKTISAPWPWFLWELGKIIATCDLSECRRIQPGPLIISEQEKAFGNYTPGRYMWTLENVKRLERPVAVKGARGLWEWEESQ